MKVFSIFATWKHKPLTKDDHKRYPVIVPDGNGPKVKHYKFSDFYP